MSRTRVAAVAAVTLVVAAAVAGWLFRVDYHLWRLRAHGHTPARDAVCQMGRAALPRLYQEVRALGQRDTGHYRAELVHIVQSIRFDEVAHRVGSRHVDEIRAAQLSADEPMVLTLALAFRSEPSAEERKRMLVRLGELDLDTTLQLFCALFDAANEQERWSLVLWLDRAARLSREPARVRADPRRVDDEAPLAERQQALTTCAIPTLVAAMGSAAPQVEPDAAPPAWLSAGLNTLRRLRSIDARIDEMLIAALRQLRSGDLTTATLRALYGVDRSEPLSECERALLVKAFANSRSEDARLSMLAYAWPAERNALVPIDSFCTVFPDLSSTSRQRVLQALDDERSETTLVRCADPLVRAVERAVDSLGPDDDIPYWLPGAHRSLARLCALSPKRAEQIRQLTQRARHARLRAALEAVLTE